MEFNVEKLHFERGESTLHMYIRHADHPEEDTYNRHDIFYMTMAEIPAILEILRGEGKFYPYFSDGGYLAQFMPNGLHYIRLSSYTYPHQGKNGAYVERWYNFDGEWFAGHLEKASQIQQGETYELDPTEFTKESWRLRPIVRWDFREGVEELVEQDKIDERVSAKEEHTLQAHLDWLKRKAGRYSDGQPVTVYFYLDIFDKDNGDPHMYHYSIVDGERRVDEGVIMPSKNKDGLFEYSPH